jgi:hypothetical protein
VSMSRESTVWCDCTFPDGSRCERFFEASGNAKQVRAEAAKQGWRRRTDGVDRCPSHATVAPNDGGEG